jgi:dTDP-4-dehydrorhamnose 3,5-epimerase
MKYKETKIKGVFVITPEPREDSRGYFTRVFAKEELKKLKILYSIVHINRSLSIDKGVVRGIHYQKAPFSEDKIIQCLNGKIFDVAVDIRKNSKTYGQWIGEELSSSNKKMLLVPKGCAHGFQTLERNSIVEYFVSQYYNPESERGIRYNDPFFQIKWPIKKAVVSEKDRKWSDFNK